MPGLTHASPPASRDARQVLAVVLRLALGKPTRDDVDADWAAVYEAASRELLAALAWHRSGHFIRTHASAGIAAAWRRAALAGEVRGERQLAMLAQVIDALRAFGVDAVVLKGFPLGDRLYANPFVRCSADIDLYVPSAQRSRASATLEVIGWERMDGVAPWHESWSIDRGGVEYHLELHSLLVSDHLAHLPAPAPSARRLRVGGVELDAHDGDFVAAYLAVHLATHQLPPLLWIVDFATAWTSLPPDRRSDAERAAWNAGVGAYLRWARTLATHLVQAADGDVAALGALGIDRAGRRDRHSIWRHLSLARSMRDRCHVLAAFLVPRRVRRDARALVFYTVARLRTRVGTLVGVTRRYAAVSSPLPTDGRSRAARARPLRVDRQELVSLAGDVVAAGGALRVRAPGGSMMPTIPRGAIVRIGPVPATGIDIGHVALALTADGEPVLHRVIALGDDGVVMRGDAAIVVDPPVPFRRVIGVATHVVDGDRWVAIGSRPRRSLAVSALKVRRRLARMVRRGG
jgi:hypothetical protein